jgi:hypothetical protein
MSDGFRVIPGDLETGSQAISEHADGYASIGETFLGATSSGTEFGTLPVSGQLSGLTTRLSTVHGSEFGAAYRVMKGGASAVHASGVNYAKADAAARFAAENIVTG